MRVELTPDRLKMLIVIHRDGKPPHRDRFDPVTAKARKAQAEACGVDPDTFADWCEQTRLAGGAKSFTVSEPAGESPEHVFFVRGIHQTRKEAKAHAGDTSPKQFVLSVLPTLAVEQLAEWDDPTVACCLDVDYHDTKAPAREWLETVVLTRVAPRPLLWHFSRSGGLHLFYVAAGDFTAEELAAAAALRFRSIDRSAGLELKTVARGPGAERTHPQADQDTGADLLQWLGSAEYDESDRDAWLESEGLECGKRYEHKHCPIDPSDGAERDPVIVSETGIYCFRCAGKGLTHGSRRPGWAPWPSILGAPSAGELGGLIRNVVHWGHAKYVLTERYGLPEPFARIAYKAALKAYHAGRPTEALLPGIFNRETEPLARVNNLWVSIPDSHVYPQAIQPQLRCLPACQIVTPEGDVKSNEAAVSELNQSKSLEARGYKNINVVHGFKLAGPYLSDGLNCTTVAVPNPELRAATTRGLPRYVPATKRMPCEEAWSTLESILPRIDRTYIRTLLTAFGCSQETRAGLLPIIFASGPTSVGKTAMAQVAAGILGARIGAEATFDPEPAKFRQGIFTGGQQGPVVVLNELLKDATRGSRHKLTTREALDFVLNMTPYSTSHQLYKGQVKMGKLPTLVITDTICPAELRDESQLARRIRHYYVSGRKEEWKRTIAAAGLTDLHLIRTASDQVARACDSILSGVVDDCFSAPATWDELADSLGVKTIEQSDEFTNPEPWLRELFRLVCAAPPLSTKESKLYAEGYKKIQRSGGMGEEESDLCIVYSMFADGPGADWAHARKLHEKHWSDILKVDDTVFLDLKGNTNGLFLRFRTGPMKKPAAVNEKIIDPSKWVPML